jgi:hypothetical protein
VPTTRRRAARELDRHQPHPAGGAVHQHGVALADAGRGERVHRGGAGEHQAGRLLPAQGRRLGHQRGRRDDELGGVAAGDAEPDDLVPHGQGDVRTDRGDHAGHLEAEAPRQRAGSVPNAPV